MVRVPALRSYMYASGFGVSPDPVTMFQITGERRPHRPVGVWTTRTWATFAARKRLYPS